MIAYSMVGTNDLARAEKFYDAVFDGQPFKKVYDSDRIKGWTAGGPTFMVCVPEDGQPASAGNGTMIALAAPNPEAIKAMHAKALEMGGKNCGDPGPRADGKFYCGYFKDLDGNKINAFCYNK